MTFILFFFSVSAVPQGGTGAVVASLQFGGAGAGERYLVFMSHATGTLAVLIQNEC